LGSIDANNDAPKPFVWTTWLPSFLVLDSGIDVFRVLPDDD